MTGYTEKKKPYGKTILLGIASATLYVILLLKQDIISEYFGKGGLNAFLPIAVAFIFSFFHGAFTGNFWTVLGIEASKKKKEVR